MTSVVRFVDVYRHFGTREVLRGLTFSVEPGEIYALLGRNGSGKTTALRVLLGFLAPHHGRSEVLGVDSLAMPPELRSRIGYVSEGHKLYVMMRVSDAVDFEAGTRPGFRRPFAEQAIRRCGLAPSQRIYSLSRGQRAQLSLILAVAEKPDVLVFDDPAMGLDVVMRREFLDAMIDVLSGEGTSVLFSSHILTDVERIADRIGILHEGHMLVDAPLDEVMRRFTKHHWVPASDGPPPDVPELVRARRRREGHDLLLLDAGGEAEARLRAGGARLSTPLAIDLEELFLDLIGPERAGILSEPMLTMREAREVSS